VWLWAQSPNTPSVDDKVGDGILVLVDAGKGVLAGSSLLEVPLEKNKDGAAKAVLNIPLRGSFDGKGGSGEEAYSFLVVHPETGQVTDSRAILSADGKTLRGTSKTKTESGTLEYSWTAIRMPKPEER
jgi:hypothetical protein